MRCDHPNELVEYENNEDSGDDELEAEAYYCTVCGYYLAPFEIEEYYARITTGGGSHGE